jgi:hypothetical protein
MVGAIIVVAIIVYALLWFFAGRDNTPPPTTVAAAAEQTIVSTTNDVTTTGESTTESTSVSTSAAPTTTAIALRTPAEVRVLVLNAVGVTGLAAEVTEDLQGIGYQVLTPSNYQPALEQSRVWYGPAFEAEAFELAGAAFPDALVELNNELTADADIVVILGASYER